MYPFGRVRLLASVCSGLFSGRLGADDVLFGDFCANKTLWRGSTVEAARVTGVQHALHRGLRGPHMPQIASVCPKMPQNAPKMPQYLPNVPRLGTYSNHMVPLGAGWGRTCAKQRHQRARISTAASNTIPLLASLSSYELLQSITSRKSSPNRTLSAGVRYPVFYPSADKDALIRDRPAETT